MTDRVIVPVTGRRMTRATAPDPAATLALMLAGFATTALLLWVQAGASIA